MTDDSHPHPVTLATPLRVRSGRFMALAALSLMLSGAALGAAGFVWWQQQQTAQALQNSAEQWDEAYYALRSQVSQAGEQLNLLGTQQKTYTDQLGEFVAQRDLLQQKVDLVDQRIATVMEGTARIDWMLAEVVHLVTVAERRLSLLGDVRGGLALLESAEQVVKAMEEPQARALRQALIDDIQALRGAEAESIDTEGLLMRLNSTKQRVQLLEPPLLSFRSEPVKLPETIEQTRYGFDLFWYKIETFTKSLVRFQENKDPNVNIAVDPQARFYLQQSITLLLDQAQLAVLRGESTTYGLALQETVDRVQRYMRIDTEEGKRVLRELNELRQQRVKQQVPTIASSLVALDAFRQAWEKGRGAREAAAMNLRHAAVQKSTDASQPADNTASGRSN